MVVETEIPPILTWLTTGSGDAPGALLVFVYTALALLVAGLVIAYLAAAFRHGPRRALQAVWRFLKQAPVDLFYISPRRVMALTMLAVREAFRGHAWVALVLFAVVLMFAGWILSPDSDEPAVLYPNFVLTLTTYLMLPVAVILSAFSLPNDLKNRTIYTVATKPVRASEIVLGRILGFTIVATILLAMMGVGSYIFVLRNLNHTHTLSQDDLVEQRRAGKVIRYEGATSIASRHRHTVSIETTQFLPEIQLESSPDGSDLVITAVADRAATTGLQVGDVIASVDGVSAAGVPHEVVMRALSGDAGSQVNLSVRRGEAIENIGVDRSIAQTETETNRGHKHCVTARWSDGEMTYTVGPADGMLQARVPRYGMLEFLDARGDPEDPSTWQYKQRGVSVGDIYAYRSYIRGNTLAAAIWTFDGLVADDFPYGLPVDLNIRVYRSHKGDVDRGIRGSIVLRNPAPDPETGRHVRTRERIFTAKEFSIDRIDVPRKLVDNNGRPIDLFKDLVHEGKLEVWVRCLDRGQYFGMGKADVYIRARNASYAMNFFKGFVGIWLQVTLVTGLAVLFSTFLSGPIAMLLTITSVIMGYNKGFLERLTIHVLTPEKMKDVAAHERVYGGGPVEAFYRIITQDNLMGELEEGFVTTLITTTDKVLMTGMEQLLRLLPDFRQFVEVDYLSNGYNIQSDLLLQHILATLAFLFAAYVIGYFFMKTREVAA